MSGLFRYAVVLACVSVHAVSAADIHPETEARTVAYATEHDAPETAPHRRAPLPPALLPTRPRPADADASPGPYPAVETLRIRRCDPVNPPPRP